MSTAELIKCPLFNGMGSQQLERIAEASRELSVRAGELIFRQGQPCDGFYVVLSGSVRVYKISPDGRERILHIVRSSHSFAEAAIFGSGVYPAFASAIENSRLVLVYREPFLRILRNDPDTSVHMFEALSMWMHRLLDQLENETFLNARAKLASYILREARNQGAGEGSCQVELRQTKKDIASQLGMAAETFSRAQADLESRKLIHTSGRQIHIPNVFALEELLLGEGGEE